MGAVKLLAFDLDGTTITEHKYLSPGNRAALVRARAAGVELVPATGRMKAFLPQEILDLPGVRATAAQATEHGAVFTIATPLGEGDVEVWKATKTS